MITNLHIKNIGIIDDLEIDLNKFLNDYKDRLKLANVHSFM